MGRCSAGEGLSLPPSLLMTHPCLRPAHSLCSQVSPGSVHLLRVVEDFIHLVGDALKAFQSSLIVTDNLGTRMQAGGGGARFHRTVSPWVRGSVKGCFCFALLFTSLVFPPLNTMLLSFYVFPPSCVPSSWHPCISLLCWFQLLCVSPGVCLPESVSSPGCLCYLPICLWCALPTLPPLQ